jgi:hypothetical protein
MEPADYQPLPPEAHAFVDGRLGVDAEREFLRRMKADPQLRERVNELRGAIGMLRDLPAGEPPAGFNERLIGRIREDELADRARQRIMRAPTPLWQYAAHVGTGAVAAALLFAVFGFPGFQPATAVEPDAPLIGKGFTPHEEDLLPALGDQFMRFDSLRRNVHAAMVLDPDLQRQLLRLELECSDLARRNNWLAPEVAQLAPDSSIDYLRFLESLDQALQLIEDEISASIRDRRAVDMTRVNHALGDVQVPAGLDTGVQLAIRGSRADVRTVFSDDGPQGIRLYAEMRRAEYRHDPEALLTAAEAFLARGESGWLTDHARAAKVSALLRLGRNAEAARYFMREFSAYDEGLTPRQRHLVQALIREGDRQRLYEARRALLAE